MYKKNLKYLAETYHKWYNSKKQEEWVIKKVWYAYAGKYERISYWNEALGSDTMRDE